MQPTNTNKGIGAIVTGIISAVVGVIMIIVGNSIDGDYSRQLESFFDYGRRDSTGHTIMVIGIAFCVLGVLLFILGMVQRYKGQRPMDVISNFNPIGAQPAGVFGRYSRPAGDMQIQINKNFSCRISQEGKIFNGTMRQIGDMTWAVDINGFMNAYTFSFADNKLHVKGGPIDEDFFRLYI